MSIIAIGLNHETAAVAIREKLVTDRSRSLEILGQLKSTYADSEFALISTCNRMELYCCQGDDRRPLPDDLIAYLARYHQLPVEIFHDALYIHRDNDAVSHLLRVTASLDSMVVGEPQIVAQVKNQYLLACDEAKTAGKVFNRLFQTAFNTSKEILAGTQITRGCVSVASVAVELALQLFSDLKKTRILVIGAGEMGELLITHLQEKGSQNITLINRSEARAKNITEKYGIATVPWGQLIEQFVDTEMVVTAVATGQPVFDKAFCKEVMSSRRKEALLIVDIAVPRNFSPAVNEIDDVYLYSIDDLAQVVDANLKARQDDIEKANGIIGENTFDFMDWFEIKDLGPLLGRMREKFQDMSQKDVACYVSGMPELTGEQQQKIEKLVHRLVNRQMHVLIESFGDMARTNGTREVTRLIQSIIDHDDRSGQRESVETY